MILSRRGTMQIIVDGIFHIYRQRVEGFCWISTQAWEKAPSSTTCSPGDDLTLRSEPNNFTV